MLKQNKFVIIIPSYNNLEWVEYNLASVLNQTYTNYEVVYIDDASTDGTYDKVVDIIKELPNWTIIRNLENKGATYNYFHNLNNYIKDPAEIVIHLDGDDWLYDETVLEKLNTFYNEKDCWMTYGGFIVWNGLEEESTLPYPQSTLYPEFIHNHKLYRQDLWRASHLRTYRAYLLQAINLDDLKSLEDGKYYWHASDLAFQYPCMEMCPKDKIQVVDFYDCVYNHSKANQVRTHERESADNSKYELEIRNRKKYKEGLNNGKLPQINVHGDYQERHNIPKKFSFVYNLLQGEYDVVFLQDDTILDYINGTIKVDVDGKIVVARVCENRKFFSQASVVDTVLNNAHKFDIILTWDVELLTLSNAVFCPLTDLSQFNTLPEVLDMTQLKVHNKSEHVACITSTKSFLPGHRTRLDIVDSIKGRVDLYGRGIREIKSKLEVLSKYRYCVVIENDIMENYYTEKITDCLLTGTIPLYYGCPNISSYFDIEGIITFHSAGELLTILDKIDERDYNNRLTAVNNNYALARNQALVNDDFYEKYYKQLIERCIL
jgi:glycosyltransferase involved in cell wall biosynthesis